MKYFYLVYHFNDSNILFRKFSSENCLLFSEQATFIFAALFASRLLTASIIHLGSVLDKSIPVSVYSKPSAGSFLFIDIVGLPAAIGVRMILDGTITDRGVLIPVKKSIYEPVLKELEEMNIGFIEKKEQL